MDDDFPAWVTEREDPDMIITLPPNPEVTGEARMPPASLRFYESEAVPGAISVGMADPKTSTLIAGTRLDYDQAHELLEALYLMLNGIPLDQALMEERNVGFDLGTSYGYDDGYDDGKRIGYEDGRDHFNSELEDQYDLGYASGYQAGLEDGQEEAA